MLDLYPYSNFHELNLDRMIMEVKRIEKELIEMKNHLLAPIVVDLAAEMTNVHQIYVYMGGEVGYVAKHWYYYDFDTNLWTDGGSYGTLDLDTSLNISSHNAVENKTITTAINAINTTLAGKQDALTIPLPIADGGTGASLAATARSNLEIGCVAIDSALIAGNEYTEYGAKKYSAFIVEGRPGVGFGDINTTIIPAAAITDTNRRYEITDDANYIDFTVRWSGNDLIIGGIQSSQADKSIALFGII